MKGKKEYLELFINFLKIGSVLFGGGYAMIPILERNLVVKKKWLTNDELLEIMSVSQMTPGTIAINAATYIGYKRAGIWGGLLASAGVIVPSLVCVTLLLFVLNNHLDNTYLVKVFTGVRACLAAMILQSVYKLFKSGIKGHVPFLIFLAALAALLTGMHPIYVILLGAVVGLSWKWLLPRFKSK